jgi:hypothetical protein
MAQGSSAMKGSHAAKLPRKSRKYRGGRVCNEPGCDTRLSVYNGRETCFLHSGTHIPRLRGRKAS